MELIIDKHDLDTAITAKGTAAGAEVIDRLVEASRLGSSLFEEVKLVVSASSYAKELEAELDKYNAKHISEEVDKEIRASLHAIAERSASSGFLEIKRKCVMNYGPAALELIVTDAFKEAHLRYAARLKSRCVGCADGLPFLPLESFVFPAPAPSCKCDAKILSDFKRARAMMADTMSDESMLSFQSIASAIGRASESYTSIDQSAVLEVEFICGGMKESLARSLDEMVLGGLPTRTSTIIDLEASVRHITTVMQQKMYGLAAREAQERVATAHDILKAMLARKPPPSHLKAAEGFWHKFFQRLELFVYEDVLEADGTSHVRRFGKEAMTIRMAAMQQRMTEAKDRVGLAELEELHTYNFVMSEPDKSRLGTWIKDIVKQRASAKRSASSAASSKPVPKKAAKRSSAASAVSAFFGDESEGEDDD